MITETTTRTIYAFDELSEQAKEKARDWYRSASAEDSFFSESVIELAKDAAAILGIDIDQVYWSGFWSQGDGACFTGRYRYRKGWKKALTADFGGELLAKLVTIGEELRAAQLPAFFTGTANISHSGRYSHSGYMSFDCDVEYGGPGDFEDAIKEALRSFADWIYAQLESEYDYQNSEETIDENIRANEYEFTEQGCIA